MGLPKREMKLRQLDVHGNLSGEPTAGSTARALGRQKERENLRKFGVYERVPRHQAVEQRVRTQWLDENKRNADGEAYWAVYTTCR